MVSSCASCPLKLLTSWVFSVQASWSPAQRLQPGNPSGNGVSQSPGLTFGGRGTSDLFPAALTLFAVTLFWEPDSSNVRSTAAIIIYGTAIVLKYHAALLLPLVGLEFLTRPGLRLRNAALRFGLTIVLILIIPSIY